jgi:hypothetical protein
MPGSTARAQVVEALGLDPDWNDADEYSFADLMGEVRKAGDAARLRDGLIEALFEPDEDPSSNDIIVRITEIARSLNEASAKVDSLDPRDEAFIWRVADALGIEWEHATGSYLVREIEQRERERVTFRDTLDHAHVPLAKRARKLRPDDTMIDIETGRTWTVREADPDAFGVTLELLAHRSGKAIPNYRIEHPDEKVTVLTPLVVRDGLVLLRKALGVQLVDYDPDDDEVDAPVVEGAWRDGQSHTCPVQPEHPHTALYDCVRYALDHDDPTFVGDREYCAKVDDRERRKAGGP